MILPLHGIPPVLAYGDGDFNGYWLLALLVITFINWVATQLKQRQARKRGEPFEVDPEDFAPYLERANREATAREGEANRAERATDEIRDFFASLTGQPVTPPKPEPTPKPQSVPVPASPPPVPRKVSAKSDSAYQDGGNAYLRRIEEGKRTSAITPASKRVPTEAQRLAAEKYQKQFGSKSKSRSSRKRNRNTGITSLLREPGSLRAAFVLREVLGPPKSLQNDGDAPTL